MKKLAIFILAIAAVSTVSAQKVQRTVAVTIDDLPVVSTRNSIEHRRLVTKNLLGHVVKAKIPAIGFVNENKLYKAGKLDEQEVDLLRSWLGAGLELGNHTYSHVNITSVPLADYKADILKGEIVTKQILAAKDKKIEYFRHPFLWTGLTLETKSELATFLGEHGYTIAPVTIDNSDWIFARAYDNAFEKGDKKLMKQVGAAYLKYMDAKTDYWERQSEKLFGREVAQTLLIHANLLNSEYLDDLAKVFRKRGYKFVALGEALKDEAYRLPDNFVKRNGISWLHRWAIDRGREFIVADEPKTPDFVLKAANVESE